MTAKEAAQRVLEEAGEPLHYETITERILESEYWTTNGETPEATVNAQLAVSIQEMGDASPFQRTAPGLYAMRSWGLDQYHTGTRREAQVRVPFYPTYRSVRAFLEAVDGEEEETLRTMQSNIRDQSGTPQNPVEWSDPDSWIEDRLSGESKKMAMRLWERTDHVVNPRYLSGVWALATTYDLLQSDTSGTLTFTSTGRAFFNGEESVVQLIDEEEGLGQILTILAPKDRAQSSELMPEWSRFLNDIQSRYASKTSQKGTLRERLANLESRGLVERDGYTYVITKDGLDYAAIFADEVGGSARQEVQRALRQHNDTQRAQLREQLHTMDPYVFEHLVRDLMEAMGYDEVEVTKQSGDKGVDVAASVQFGITSVKEVVQVKRYKSNVQRTHVDELRGALYHHDAIQGTLLTTSGFSKGAKDAALLPGAPPISLIDGDRLVDLLIEHEIGIQKKTIIMYDVDGGYFGISSRE
jgi:restriction system protein